MGTLVVEACPSTRTIALHFFAALVFVLVSREAQKGKPAAPQVRVWSPPSKSTPTGTSSFYTYTVIFFLGGGGGGTFQIHSHILMCSQMKICSSTHGDPQWSYALGCCKVPPLVHKPPNKQHST